MYSFKRRHCSTISDEGVQLQSAKVFNFADVYTCGERRNELLTVFEKEAFIRGFKLGAKMAAEVLSED